MTDHTSSFHQRFPGKKIVSVDFDGVLHHYTSGWAGASVINDPPTPGAIPWLLRLVRHKRIAVIIHSCRLIDDPLASEAISAWLLKHITDHYENQKECGERRKAEVWAHDIVSKIYFSAMKPPAAMYIDDRGFQFQGQFPSIDYILNYVPWNKRKDVGQDMIPVDPQMVVLERDKALEALSAILMLCSEVAETNPKLAVQIRQHCAEGSEIAAQITGRQT